MKKTLILLLALLIGIQLFAVSCKQDSTPSVTTENDEASQTTVPEETEEEFLGYLPDKTYSDEVFDALVRQQDQDSNYTAKEPEKETVISSAVYRSYSAVAERFDTDYHFTGLNGYSSGQKEFLDTIIADVNAGGTFDLVAPSYYFGVTLIIQGYYQDLNKLSYINFEKPWWHEGFNSPMELDGSLYACGSAFDMGVLKNTYALAFNETMINNYGLESPYDLYNNNQWILEKLLEMADSVGSSTESEEIGLAITRKSSDCFFQASGLRFVEKDAHGNLKISLYSEKAETLYQTLYGYVKGGTNACKFGGSPDKDFLHGKTLFAAMTIGNLVNLTDSSFKYGVAVYPKYDSAQQNYYSTTAGSSVFAITKTAPNTEFSSVMLEALSAHFYQEVTPAIFETVLQGRVSQRPETASMLEIIRDSLYYDFGFLWNNSLGKIANFTSYMEDHQSMSSWYQTQESTFKEKLNIFLTEYGKIPQKLNPAA